MTKEALLYVPRCQVLTKRAASKSLQARLIRALLALCGSTKERGKLAKHVTSAVLCQRCHKPLANSLSKVSERTETCIPGPRFYPRTMSNGQRIWYSDGGEIECSDYVMFPRGTEVD